MYLCKKIIPASGLMLIVALPLFFSVTMLVKQGVLQHQRNEKFNKEILQTITVSAENIYWVKAGKEILFNGKLFDVKSFKTAGSNIYLTGFFDHKEDKLVQRIVKLALQKNQASDSLGSLAIQFLFFPVSICQPEITYQGSWKFISQQYYSFDEMLSASPGYSLIHPPRL